jgi:hypothetical protein
MYTSRQSRQLGMPQSTALTMNVYKPKGSRQSAHCLSRVQTTHSASADRGSRSAASGADQARFTAGMFPVAELPIIIVVLYSSKININCVLIYDIVENKPSASKRGTTSLFE